MISIVVAVYNGEKSIADCIESLLSLRGDPSQREIILVDNNSKDSTLKILKHYEDKIAILQESTRGAAAARNTGIRFATGDLIAFTDADCFVDPDWLHELTAPLCDPTIGIAGGRILARPAANSIERFGELVHDHRLAIEHYKPAYAISMNWATPRIVFEQVGLFDESLLRGQDVDLAYRIVDAGFRLVYANDAIIYHLNESTLLGLFNEGFTHGRHSLRIARKHRSTREFEPRKAYTSRLRQVGKLIKQYFRQSEHEPRSASLYALIFDTGKVLGFSLGLLEGLGRQAPLSGSCDTAPSLTSMKKRR